MNNTFDENLRETLRTFNALADQKTAIDGAVDAILRCMRTGCKILVCGNGGSAAEAQHFTTELVGRYCSNRKSLPAISLTADPTLLTCIGNDFGWDEMFARQVDGLAQPGDVFVGMSTSGNSPNVLRAFERAQSLGLATILMLGKGGGKGKGRADFEVTVPSQKTGAVQEAHLFVIHYFCERIEQEFSAKL